MLNLLTEEEVAFIKVSALVRYRPEELEAWLASQPVGGSAMETRAPRPVVQSARA